MTEPSNTACVCVIPHSALVHVDNSAAMTSAGDIVPVVNGVCGVCSELILYETSPCVYAMSSSDVWPQLLCCTYSDNCDKSQGSETV